MHSLKAHVLLGFFFLALPSARAGNKEAEKAAKKACLTGKPDKGVEILTDLYLERNDPNYIFNQGRCFEQNNRYEDAIGRFREYLRKAKDASAADRADAEKHIAECRAVLGEKKAAEPEREPAAAPIPAPVPAPIVTSPAPAPLPVALPPTPLPAQTPVTAAALPGLPPQQLPADAVAQTAPSPPSNSGRGLRIAGLASGLVGLASVGAGVYFYTQARSYSDKVSKQRPANPADQDAGKSAETKQWVFYGVGSAAVATGVVLYIFGLRADDSNRGLASIAPILGPGVMGLSAQGAF